MMVLHRKIVPLVLSLAVLSVLVAVALAQPGSYDLSRWTVDGGGGMLEGGGYTLRGTAGQPDAAVWQGGGYTLAGGFWGGSAGPVAYDVYLPIVLRGFP
jgi:hypothetical protein